MSSNSSLTNKRKRKDPRQQMKQEEQEEMIESLCAKRNPTHLATNTPFESINADDHSDLRQVKWSLMVGPALRPKNLFGQQIQQLQINDPVVHVIAIRRDLETDSDGSMYEVHECVRSLGYLGGPQDIMHLGTVEQVQLWRTRFLSSVATDGEPRFHDAMVNLRARQYGPYQKRDYASTGNF